MKSDTWEVIVWLCGGWWRCDVRHPDRVAAERCAEHLVARCTPFEPGATCYVRTTRELDSIGLPEGPPPSPTPRSRAR